MTPRRWPPLGDAQRDVLDTLRRTGRALSVAALAEDTGRAPDRCGAIAASLAARGLVERVDWSAREHGWAAVPRCATVIALPLTRSPTPSGWVSRILPSSPRATPRGPDLDEWAEVCAVSS